MKLLDKLRGKDAETEAREIVQRAQRDAGNRLREAELEIKERAIHEKAAAEREMFKIRDELRERERGLDKRQETVEQQTEYLRKQERIVENTQRRLAERLEDTNRRNEELSKLLDMQRQTLHAVSGLTREEATRRLLDMLERELNQEAGATILRHRKQVEETCEQQARELLLTALHRYAAAHTAESTTSTVGIPNDEMKGRIIGREGAISARSKKKPAWMSLLMTRRAW